MEQNQLANYLRMGRTTLNNIIKETCQAIWDTLQPEVLKVPSRHEWISIADQFFVRWNFPHCVGAIDGKHVVIQAPALAGSSYYNYKNQHSIVLMAACDGQYRFTLVDIGAPGRNSDGGIFANSPMGVAMESGGLDLPSPSKINGTSLPYVFVGDEAFPLKTYLMRPFPRHDLRPTARNEQQLQRSIYNYRLSRARRLIENVFGIWSARWRVFKRPIIADTNTVELYIKATICLHNWLRNFDCTDDSSSSDHDYNPPGFADTELPDGSVQDGQWRQEESGGLQPVKRTGSNMYSADAAGVRQKFTEYFSSPEGSVQWQLPHVLKGIIDEN